MAKKFNLKKTLLMGTAYVLVAALAIGSTIAWLTGEDSDVNVMALGNVSIEQIEQEWNEDQTALQEFTQDKPLYPYVGSFGWKNTAEAGGAYRRFTMNNVIDKYVSVRNTGKTDAFVRTFVALEMGDVAYEDLGDLLGVSVNKYNGDEFQFEGAWDWTYDGTIQIEGKPYNVMVAVHQNALGAGETTIPSLNQVYMNKNATNEDCEKLDGNGNGTYDILVLSQAVQADGFADAATALNTAFGDPAQGYNPWNAKTIAWPGAADTWDGTVDETWYGPEAETYGINTAEELAAFAQAANAGDTFAGKVVVLNRDIDLSGKAWTPINSFAGEFNGQNHTISNFSIDATQASGGFFKTIEAGDGERVHDLTLSDITATVGAYRFGTLANNVKGIVNRVTVSDVEVTATHTSAWVGGMCAFMNWPWMNDCTVENVTVNAENGADLIGGFSCILQKNSNMVFDNNDVNGFKVTVTDTDSSGCGVAGFVTQTQRGWEYPKIINTDVTGIDIVAAGNVDSAGFIAWPGAHTTAENCTVKGKIDATGVTSEKCFAGGFFGNLGWNADLGQMGHVVKDCSADVDIRTSVAPAGGFVGSATNSNTSSMYATFVGCKASGDITSTGSAPVGGFAGDADRGSYTDCTATGRVQSASGAVGGFIGETLDTTPKYDSRYPKGTRVYPVDWIQITDCTGTDGADFIDEIANQTKVNITQS